MQNGKGIATLAGIFRRFAVPIFSGNQIPRVSSKSKEYLTDTGLTCYGSRSLRNGSGRAAAYGGIWKNERQPETRPGAICTCTFRFATANATTAGFIPAWWTRRCAGRTCPLPGRELRLLAEDAGRHVASRCPAHVYFGGGTPAMLGEGGLRELAAGLRETVSLDGVEEWTVELNPVGVTPAFAGMLRKLGVNRVSIGAQCFDDEVLRGLGRRNTVRDVKNAVDAVRAEGFTSIGLDLIAGLPGVTPELWRASLNRRWAMDVPHVSVYALNLEPGTELARRAESGAVEVPDAEAQLAALSVAEHVLGTAGLARYEISNFARPGSECRHNLAAWRGEDYIGLGPSASSRAGPLRWTNHADLASYLRYLTDGVRPPHRGGGTGAGSGRRGTAGFRSAVAGRAQPGGGSRAAIPPPRRGWRNGLRHCRAWNCRNWSCALRMVGWRLTERGREVADAVVTELSSSSLSDVDL